MAPREFVQAGTALEKLLGELALELQTEAAIPSRFGFGAAKYEAGEFTDELAEAVRIAECERKIVELERKVGQLTMEMEVDLLKKEALLGRRVSDGA